MSLSASRHKLNTYGWPAEKGEVSPSRRERFSLDFFSSWLSWRFGGSFFRELRGWCGIARVVFRWCTPETVRNWLVRVAPTKKRPAKRQVFRFLAELVSPRTPRGVCQDQAMAGFSVLSSLRMRSILRPRLATCFSRSVMVLRVGSCRRLMTVSMVSSKRVLTFSTTSSPCS